MSDKLPLPPYPDDTPRAMSRWRHRNGTVYTVLASAREEATLTPVVVYYSPTDPLLSVWTRPVSEFLDGRFTEEKA